MSVPTSNLVKSSCQHCGGGIEFDADQAGVDISCPHCGVTTRLAVMAPAPKPAEGAIIPLAKKNVKGAAGLRVAATFFVMIGLILTIAGLVTITTAPTIMQEIASILLGCSGV